MHSFFAQENNSVMGNFSYTYNSLGNLLTVSKNSSVTKTFGYTNGRRTSCNGNDITYDTYGNVTGYPGSAFIWNSRDCLNSYNNSSYEYNSQGIRFKKSANEVDTYYYLDGDKILGEDRSDGKKIRYHYDAEGIAGFSYNGNNYYYTRDGLGNISKISYFGMLIGEYNYDAWGNFEIIQNTGGIADINPFRWKTYYYDEETKWYYINGRYYDQKCY